MHAHHHTLILALCLAATAAPLAAQAATYTYVAQKGPYTDPTPPFLVANSLPKLGTNLQLQVPYSWVQRNRNGADFILATGITNPNIPIPTLNGFLYTSAEVLLNTPQSPLGAPGTTVMSIPIPSSVALLGVRFHQQILESTFLVTSLRLGRGGVGVIGM